jgi:hypothetical protein
MDDSIFEGVLRHARKARHETVPRLRRWKPRADQGDPGRKAGRAGFYYYVIPKVDPARGRRATALELVRRSSLVARQMLPLPYQAPKQPGPLALRAAQHVLDSLLPPNLG